MPARHLFADEAATHGRSLCGLDVKPHPEPSKRSAWNCPACQKAWKRKARVTPPSRRKHYTDRIAED